MAPLPVSHDIVTLKHHNIVALSAFSQREGERDRDCERWAWAWSPFTVAITFTLTLTEGGQRHDIVTLSRHDIVAHGQWSHLANINMSASVTLTKML